MQARIPFARGFFLRLGLLLLAVAGLAVLALQPGYVMATVAATAAVLAIALDFLRYVKRTNTEVSRFLEAVRFADMSQNFSLGEVGTGFDELGKTLNDSLGRLRSSRDTAERDVRFLKALVDHVPVALVAIHGSGRVDLLNNAARRMFGPGQVKSLPDLAEFGAGFVRDLSDAKPGERRLTHIVVEGVRQGMALSVSQVSMRDGAQRVVSLQNIQEELNATELSTWRDLVRVLTHEIMNSITPVASLSKTAAGLMADAHADASQLADARDAVETVARRSEGLQRFVQSYRQLTKLPPPQRKPVAIGEMFGRLERLFRIEWTTIQLHVSVTPKGLELFADPELVEQALINILRNAAQAADKAAGEVWLSARLNRLGRVVIAVADNGAGVPADVRDSVFLPFFTTKKDGTGVGLSLARQIVLAHGGAITLSERDGGGALFALTF